jgi:hypothetical protein
MALYPRRYNTLEGSDLGLTGMLSRYLPGKAEENQR